MSRIFVTGDTHADLDIWNVDEWAEMNFSTLTRDDYFIILGDFGALWFGDNRDSKLLDWWENMPFTTLWLDGNHENFNLIEQYEVSEWNGGRVQYMRPHVIHLMRGEIYTLNERTFFVMGGATSVDRAHRTPGRSWWEQEMPNFEEMDHAFQNLEAHDFKVDYVLTHCAPTRFLPTIFKGTWFDVDPLNRFLDQLAKQIEYRQWYFGHYHIDRPGDTWRALYDDIIEIA